MTTIDVHHLTKRFGRTTAVDDLSFRLEAGTVTGFLGRNGAGKTTTLRSILGLVRPTAGRTTINGRAYAELEHPATVVGAVLDASGVPPGRRARDHLRILATASAIPPSRVEETLEFVGLGDVGHRRVGGFSLGMRQRLAIAAALLGEPEILVLDEPTNGLDPDGMRWLRALIRDFGANGGTALLSSHLLAEIAGTVDHVLVIEGGRLVAASPVADLRATVPTSVRVRTPMVDQLLAATRTAGWAAAPDGPDAVLVRDTPPEAVGRLVAASGIVVYELGPVDAGLEQTFFSLVHAAPQEARR
jgi:ABC-2 type transport system ATP-binding protein